jgi:hypothetical protein
VRKMIESEMAAWAGGRSTITLHSAMSIERFRDLMVSSGLSNRPESDALVARFRKEWSEADSPEEVEAFCRFLISTNLFTNWQCSKLQAGKWKGFYLDNHLLLEQIGKVDEFSYYKARDTRDGKLVQIKITPMRLAKGPHIEYCVEPYIDRS